MTSPDPRPSVCDWSGKAAPSLLGKLTSSEDAVFRAHLSRGCRDCQEEFDEAREGLADMDLAQAIEAPEPVAPTVKSLVLDAVSRQEQDAVEPAVMQHSTWQSKSDADNPAAIDGLHTRGTDEGDWEPTNVPGVRTRTLRVDEAQRRVTMLVEMNPGTSYPPHRHAAAEECFVVSGDIRVGDRTLRTGDFQYADAGSVHGTQSTEGGCTLLIVSSQEDVLI